jgi:hypothetical protein
MRRTARAAVVALAAMALLSGCLEADVRTLSSDAMAGRANDTPGSLAAQDHILRYLESWTEGVDPSATGREAYKQRFDAGTNLIGIIPGTDLADEYVLVGAHYDGLGTSCRRATAEDTICNGATDNATGAAIVLDIARHLHYSGVAPRRSVIVAFWDREEDGLLGAQAFANAPGVSLAKIAAYVNLDIQGANLRPSGRDLTFAVGAETGGSVLTQATAAAAAPSPLDTRLLSLIFGLGRSDHAVFAARNVPSVFFTDSTGPCYHTVDDEAAVVDFSKLRAQSDTARRLVVDLANRPDRPTFATGLPLATFDDAQSVADLLDRLTADRETFSDADWATFLDRKAVVDGVVAAGPGGFDSAAMTSMLLAINDVVNLLARADCDGYLVPDN